MKVITAVVTVVAFAIADPPPSHSYLPPPPISRNAGYPRGLQISSLGGPEVVAARTIDGQNHNGPNHGANAIGRNGAQAHSTSKFSTDAQAQGYDHNSPFAKNALEEANSEPANYNFGYMVNDYHEGTDFGHHEERQEERAQGQYHVVLPDGRKQTVSYEADERGFKPQISYQDSEDLTRSAGYDANTRSARANGGGVRSNSLAHNGGHF